MSCLWPASGVLRRLAKRGTVAESFLFGGCHPAGRGKLYNPQQLSYSCLLRGDTRRARRLLERAMLLAPGDPAIANNIAVMDAGLAYFHGSGR
jgi:hypothetical protein